MKRFFVFLLLVIPSSLVPGQQRPQPAVKPLVLTNVTVIDATGAEARTGMAIIMTNDRITAIGKTSEVKLPNNAQVVDAAGKFLIPGLWDMHTHLLHADFLRLFIANGVTGIREMGGEWAQVGFFRNGVKEGKQMGPRIFAAGPYVDGPNPIWPSSVRVTDQQQGRQIVAKLKQSGVDFIKVYSMLPRDVYLAIADEAKKQGIPFVGHVPFSISAAEAVDAGQKSIEHLDMILRACSDYEEEANKELQDAMNKPDAIPAVLAVLRSQARKIAETYNEEKAQSLFAKMAKNGVRICPTLSVQRAISMLNDSAFTADPRLKYLPLFITESWNPKNDVRLKGLTADELAAARETFGGLLNLVGAMHRAGVEILPGTDTPNPYCFPGFSLHDELALLVEAGLTPMEALQAATRNAAKFLGLQDSAGTIEQGKIANLVLLEADPLADIANTKKVHAVITNGKLLDQAALRKMLAEVEATAGRK